jgi:hypothetical protein
MAFLFLGGGDMFLFRRHPLGFLGATTEIIVQSCRLLNQFVPVGRESLDGLGVFNIGSQAFIELGHLSAFVPADP